MHFKVTCNKTYKKLMLSFQASLNDGHVLLINDS